MSELQDITQVELENSLVNAVQYLPLYIRMRSIARFGVKDLDEVKLLKAMLTDMYE